MEYDLSFYLKELRISSLLLTAAVSTKNKICGERRDNPNKRNVMYAVMTETALV